MVFLEHLVLREGKDRLEHLVFLDHRVVPGQEEHQVQLECRVTRVLKVDLEQVDLLVFQEHLGLQACKDLQEIQGLLVSLD